MKVCFYNEAATNVSFQLINVGL